MWRALNSHLLLLDAQAQGWWLCWKKVKFSSKSNPGERCSQRRKFTSALSHEFTIVSLVAFENFEWLLMTLAVICNNCDFTKQNWSNILSNEFLGGNIWMLPAILSHVQCQWKVCYNKLKQGNFQKNWCWRLNLKRA